MNNPAIAIFNGVRIAAFDSVLQPRKVETISTIFGKSEDRRHSKTLD
jgi:hypothetical protein